MSFCSKEKVFKKDKKSPSECYANCGSGPCVVFGEDQGVPGGGRAGNTGCGKASGEQSVSICPRSTPGGESGVEAVLGEGLDAVTLGFVGNKCGESL